MTYEQTVAAEVAARYGLPVIGAVQIIPRGVSGLPEYGNWIAQRDAQRANQARIRRVVATQEPPAPKTRTPAPRPERLVQRDAQLRQMAEQGMTASAISQRLGITRNAVYAAARTLGVEITRQVRERKPKKPQVRTPKPERVKIDHTPRIREMAEAGAGTHEISAAIGISRAHVSQLARRAGLNVPKAPRRAPTEALDRHQQVLRAHLAGLHPAAICSSLGLSREKVRRSLLALKVVPNRAKRVTDMGGFAVAVRSLRNDGLSYAAIAIALGVPKPRVAQVLTGAAVRMEVAA